MYTGAIKLIKLNNYVILTKKREVDMKDRASLNDMSLMTGD